MAFSAYLVHLGILACMYIMLIEGLNLTVGFGGMLNLGHVAFFGIGAYATAILSTQPYNMPLWLTVFAAIILSAIGGVLLALPTARLKGDYLALATLGFTFIMAAVARNWQGLTRGALGIPGIPRLLTSPELSSNEAYLFIILLATVLVTWIVVKLTRSHFGRRLQAVRDDETAAMVLGVNAFWHKVLAMAISAALAGLAGFFYAHYITFIDPTIFSIDDLVLMFSMVIVGGLASTRGSVVGAVLLFLLPEPLRFVGFPSSIVGPMRAILYALLLLIIIIYKPKGLFGKVDLT